MPKRLLKYKNYDVHSITTITSDGQKNANIATWVMQTAMGGTHLVVALYKTDYTIELVRESGILNVNLLATDQTSLIRKLGQQSGRPIQGGPIQGGPGLEGKRKQTDKFRTLPYALDERGCPYLTEAIGYAQCQVLHTTDSGDHELFVCAVLKQVVLNPDKAVMTNDFIKEKKLVRG
ncbi:MULTISPECIES: flavin reductase family protein [Spirosoma]|uniref:Flavin reductase n=1 Tax=Spirosoma sordidisoli TaxID=2502893 RepID=A0A4Q2UJW1_9BACT|nr:MULTISPECIES: flavin reductase family protein [Spirosoma]RYC67750.1 flavin reductase [Spirosoma sordidisoli]